MLDVKSLLNSTDVDVPFENGAAKLKDGTRISGDVVTTADGIKSVICGELLGDVDEAPLPTGNAVCRCMLSQV